MEHPIVNTEISAVPYRAPSRAGSDAGTIRMRYDTKAPCTAEVFHQQRRQLEIDRVRLDAQTWTLNPMTSRRRGASISITRSSIDWEILTEI